MPHEHATTPPGGPEQGKGYEPETTSIGGVALFGVALLLMIAASMAAMVGLLGGFETSVAREDPEPSPLAPLREVPPAPRLQVSEPRDLRELREQEDAVLNSYEWIDRKNGVVRIPIERAMELVAQRANETGSADGDEDASNSKGDE